MERGKCHILWFLILSFLFLCEFDSQLGLSFCLVFVVSLICFLFLYFTYFFGFGVVFIKGFLLLSEFHGKIRLKLSRELFCVFSLEFKFDVSLFHLKVVLS